MLVVRHFQTYAGFGGVGSGFPSFTWASNLTTPPVDIRPWSSLERDQTESQEPQPSLAANIVYVTTKDHPAGTWEG